MRLNTKLGPKPDSMAHRAMTVLHDRGAMGLKELRTAAHCIKSQGNFDTLMQSWLECGWLLINADQQCDLTPMARRVFNGDQDAPKFIGSMATGPQFNMLTRPPYKSPRRVVRADVPAWSVRPDGFGFKALSGACGVVA